MDRIEEIKQNAFRVIRESNFGKLVAENPEAALAIVTLQMEENPALRFDAFFKEDIILNNVATPHGTITNDTLRLYALEEIRKRTGGAGDITLAEVLNRQNPEELAELYEKHTGNKLGASYTRAQYPTLIEEFHSQARAIAGESGEQGLPRDEAYYSLEENGYFLPLSALYMRDKIQYEENTASHENIRQESFCKAVRQAGLKEALGENSIFRAQDQFQQGMDIAACEAAEFKEAEKFGIRIPKDRGRQQDI